MSVYAHGGTGIYNYALGAGTYGTAGTFTTLAAGAYTVHVRDANGCIKDTTVTLAQPSVLAPSALVRPSVCNTLANGQVTLSASGGTPTYTYAIGTGAYSATTLFSPLAAGTYTFHVMDANGCISDTAITITDSLLVSSLLTITPAACYQQASGAVTATGTGGASPYTYALGTHAYGTSGTYTGLPAGMDTIHIKDVNGCLADTIITISQPTKIEKAIIITTPSCYGYVNGAVGITVTGGTPSYTYSFDNSAFTATTTYIRLAAGTDSILVKDANGCLSDTTFSITQPSGIFFDSVKYTNISCFNGTDGTVTVSGTGATPPYTYDVDTLAWQPGTLFAGLGAGLKLVRIKDALGCEIDTTVLLTQPDQLLISNVDTVNATCPGYKDGSIKLYATGGTTPYVYSDDNITFGANNSFTELAAGAYTCYVRDANNCITDTTITLLGLPHIIIDTLGITPPLCYLGTDGAIAIGATGGVPALTYSLDTGIIVNTSGTFSNLAAAIYIMRIKDSRDCFVDTAVIVTQPDSINIDTVVTPNECKGTNDQGAVVANVTGGTPPYTYLWNTTPAQTVPAITGLPNGAYMVTVTDANKCTTSIVAHVIYDNCCTPFIPNAFTPNDDGVDDIFRLRVKGDMHIVVFSVYNRFGQVVYTETNTDDLDKGWNGKFNGINADLGVYYYYAKIICGNRGNNTVELKGDVTLVR
jgi:gliding motility-associated-like protein